MSQGKIKLLYVDEKPSDLEEFRAISGDDLDLLTTDSLDEATQLLDDNEVHVVIAGQRLHGQTGVDLLDSFKNTYPQVVRILLTDSMSAETLVEAVNKSSVYKFIGKPVAKQGLVKICKEAYNYYTSNLEQASKMLQLERTNQQLEFMLREKLIS